MKKRYIPWIKALSAISSNIAAGWFGVTFITPNFTDIFRIEGIVTLTQDILLGILFLIATVLLERLLLS